MQFWKFTTPRDHVGVSGFINGFSIEQVRSLTLTQGTVKYALGHYQLDPQTGYALAFQPVGVEEVLCLSGAAYGAFQASLVPEGTPLGMAILGAAYQAVVSTRSAEESARAALIEGEPGYIADYVALDWTGEIVAGGGQ